MMTNMKSNQKRTPKWYLITSAIIVCVLFLDLLLMVGITVTTMASTLEQFFNYSLLLLLFGVIGVGWAVFNFVLLIYFLAKKYERISLILPISFIVQSLIFVPLNNAPEILIFIEMGMFSLFIIVYSLYKLWKE